MSKTGQAWVTLVTNDSYALGALVLAQSLRRSSTIHQLAVLVTPGVTNAMIEVLSQNFDLVKVVDVLDSQDATNLALLARPELGITFTKLHCWNLTQYSKCVFLDADTLVVKNCDELFEREELSAAPDAGWPDCFNSGVFVYTPSEETFKALLNFALTNGSFDGGDQGLLNMYFSDWATKDIMKHLPFVYNMVATATYSYLPAFQVFGSNVKIAHFIGSNKPWLQSQHSSPTLSSFLDLWWSIFKSDVSNKLNTEMGGLAGAMAGGQQDVIDDQWRKQSWEQGNIDYMGRDAFQNIWRKMSETVGEDIKPLEASAPEEPAEPQIPTEAEVEQVPEKTDSKTELPKQESTKDVHEGQLSASSDSTGGLPKPEEALQEVIAPVETGSPAQQQPIEQPVAQEEKPAVPESVAVVAQTPKEADSTQIAAEKSSPPPVAPPPVVEDKTPPAAVEQPSPPVAEAAPLTPAQLTPPLPTVEQASKPPKEALSEVLPPTTEQPAVPPGPTVTESTKTQDPPVEKVTESVPKEPDTVAALLPDKTPEPTPPVVETPQVSPVVKEQVSQPSSEEAAQCPLATKASPPATPSTDQASQEKALPTEKSPLPSVPSTPPVEKTPSVNAKANVESPPQPPSPTIPSALSPSSPEGSKAQQLDQTPPSPLRPDNQQTTTAPEVPPAAAGDAPVPQTAVGDAPVPPKRKSTKGKTKK